MSAAVASSSSYRLTFGGLLKAEWIKLWSLRSTYWCLAIMFVLWVGIALLVSTLHGPNKVVEAPQAVQQSLAAQVATAGTTFGELIVAVLGVLVISGEYGTGMIRSTLTADPRRLPTLFAKGIVLAVTVFIAGLVSIVAAAAVGFPLLAGQKVYPELSDGKLDLALLGDATYLAIIALIAFSLGAIIRATAGGIAAALGLILVVPIVLGILVQLTQAQWAENISGFAPTNAGAHLYRYVVGTVTNAPGAVNLDATTGPLVFVAWLVLFFVIAAVLLKRRDA